VSKKGGGEGKREGFLGSVRGYLGERVQESGLGEKGKKYFWEGKKY